MADPEEPSGPTRSDGDAPVPPDPDAPRPLDDAFDEGDAAVLSGDAFDEGDGSTSVLQGAARAAVILTAAGLAGQVFTLLRELFVAAEVGVAPSLDALLIAAVAPLMLASFLSSGPAAAIVPGYLEAKKEGGTSAADRLLGASLTWVVIIGIGLSLLIVAAAGIAVAITGPGLDEATRTLAIGYVPVLAPMLVFYSTGAMLAATFQIHDRMRAIAVAWMAGPVVSFAITVAFWDRLGLTALAVAMTAQQAAIVVVLIVLALWFRILPPLTFRADRAESARFVRHAMPLTISASVLQFNLLTDRAIATLITPGAVAALRYAEGIIRIPMSSLGPAWSAAIYPALVRASLLEAAHSFAKAAGDALRYVVVIFVPLAVATAALAPVIVEVAYVRGAFDERAAVLTAGSLVGFAPLFVLTMIQAVLTGAHNARRRGVFLMTMGFLDAILNFVFNVGLGWAIGVAGIALSTSLTMAVIQAINAWRLGTIEKDFPLATLISVSGKALLASALVAVPIAVIAWNLPHGMGLTASFALLVILATAGMVGYIALSRLIGLAEPLEVAQALLRAPRRLRPGAG